MEPSLSTELAIRAFDADAAFSAALAEFQAGPREESLAADARRASEHGLSWYARPSEVAAFQVVLCHKGGAEREADGQSISALLAGLLGHPLAHDVAILAAQASEPEQKAITLGPEHEATPAGGATAAAGRVAMAPAPAQLAAESLAAATGGVVVAEVAAGPDPDATQPLTDEQKAVCVGMIKALSADQRNKFTISFRDAFRVPWEAKAIAPLITEVRHMEFCDRWSIEASGGVAP
jgi:hypothetical protein